MSFFGIGPLELLVILVVALVFVGPERLPRLAADLARTIRELRKYTSAIADEFGDVIKDFEKETEGERSQLTQISEGLTGATKSVTEVLRGARADAEGTSTAAAPALPASNGAAIPPGNGAAWKEIAEPEAAPPSPEPAPAENGVAPRSPAPAPPPAEDPA